MPDFRFQLNGYKAANRDAEITLVEEISGTQIKRKPFLDGSLNIKNLKAGFYQIKVKHPNLIHPIFTNRVRLFPQKNPTVITVPVPEDIFSDTPIRDIPDADLGPVQQSVNAAMDSLSPIGDKVAGEVVRSSDWNILVGAVRDFGSALQEITNLVAVRGHDHPEIAEKIDQVQGNFINFSEAYGKSLLQIQREIEALNMRRSIEGMYDRGQVPEPERKDLLDRIDELANNLELSTPVWTKKLANAAGLLLSQVNTIASNQDDPDIFINDEQVQQVLAFATQYHNSGSQSSPESELNIYRKTNSLAKSSKFFGK
ncbi:MAG: hypothetical protein COA42_11755 [Alteromonadaceae bacterium]|nr:MAG: hypothetical protein COA42_11755 [Alteromonadaceae bacterium]